MRATLILTLMLLSACGRNQPETAEAGPEGTGSPPRRVFNAEGNLTRLTGLYESGRRQVRSQLCIIESSGMPARFAMVVRGAGDRSCSGGGMVSRDGEALTFTMAGESDCRLRARVEGREVILSDTAPAGCSYYCTAGTDLGGTRFAMVAASVEDALRARDLAGEPLCGGAPRPG